MQNIKNPLKIPVTRTNFRTLQIESKSRRQTKCISNVEICQWKGTKHYGKMRNCWFSPYCIINGRIMVTLCSPPEHLSLSDFV